VGAVERERVEYIGYHPQHSVALSGDSDAVAGWQVVVCSNGRQWQAMFEKDEI